MRRSGLILGFFLVWMTGCGVGTGSPSDGDTSASDALRHKTSTTSQSTTGQSTTTVGTTGAATTGSVVYCVGGAGATSAGTSAGTSGGGYTGTTGAGTTGSVDGGGWGTTGSVGDGGWGTTGSVGDGGWGTTGSVGDGGWGTTGSVGDGGGWGTTTGSVGDGGWGTTGSSEDGGWGTTTGSWTTGGTTGGVATSGTTGCGTGTPGTPTCEISYLGCSGTYSSYQVTCNGADCTCTAGGQLSFHVRVASAQDACTDAYAACGFPSVVFGSPSTSAGGSSTPLILDFDGAAVQFTRAPGAFELTGLGATVATDWVGAATPWLALDRNGNGRIDSGEELFGSMTVLPGGERAKNGFEALRALDSNHDGRIDSRDAAFGALVLWRDANQDRRSQPGELTSLAASGVVGIELGYGDAARCDSRGNCERERARFQFRGPDGQLRSGAVVDVHLAHHPALLSAR